MRSLKYLFISLVLALGMSFRADAVSDKMQEIKYIPEDSEQVANGYGWTVYQKVTERTEMYDASILYLENDVTNETSYTAVHIPAYNSFQNRTSKINGKLYLEFSTADYSSGYREDILVLYDLEGNRLQ